MADDGLVGSLGTLIVAGAVLGAMNNRKRSTTKTRTITKTRYITKKKGMPKKRPKVITTTKTTVSREPNNWLY